MYMGIVEYMCQRRARTSEWRREIGNLMTKTFQELIILYAV